MSGTDFAAGMAMLQTEFDYLRIALETREEDLGQARRDLEAMEAEVERLLKRFEQEKEAFAAEHAEAERVVVEAARLKTSFREATEARVELFRENQMLQVKLNWMREALRRIADPEEFDLNSRAMRQVAQDAVDSAQLAE